MVRIWYGFEILGEIKNIVIYSKDLDINYSAYNFAKKWLLVGKAYFSCYNNYDVGVIHIQLKAVNVLSREVWKCVFLKKESL